MSSLLSTFASAGYMRDVSDGEKESEGEEI